MYSIEMAQEMLVHLKKFEDYYTSGDWIGALRTLPKGNRENRPNNINDATYVNFLFKLSFGGEHIYDVLKKCYEKLKQELKLKYFEIVDGSGTCCIRLQNKDTSLKMKLYDFLEINILEGSYKADYDSFLSLCHKEIEYIPSPVSKCLLKGEVDMYSYKRAIEYLKNPSLIERLRTIRDAENYRAKSKNEKIKLKPKSLIYICRTSKKKIQQYVENCEARIEKHERWEHHCKERSEILSKWLGENEPSIRNEYDSIIRFITEQLGYVAVADA